MEQIKSKNSSKGWMAVGIIMAILVIDQAVKIWVKTHMSLHECIPVFGWFKILFIENNGMAYGMEIGSKMLLSILRILLIGLLGYYLVGQVKRGAKTGYLVCLSMIIAGAAGNIIDGMFYGMIFNASSDYYVSYFVPFGQGYAPTLMGKVVDMLYFPLIETVLPEWVPFIGGSPYVFFSPVFNIADSSISLGVVFLLLFYRKEISEITFSRKSEHEDK